jgi:hypothetical protein
MNILMFKCILQKFIKCKWKTQAFEKALFKYIALKAADI